MISENFYVKLGKNIKKRRKFLNMTQEELANKVGIGLNFMGKIEVAFSKPSLDTLLNIADALEISLRDLLDFK